MLKEIFSACGRFLSRHGERMLFAAAGLWVLFSLWSGHFGLGGLDVAIAATLIVYRFGLFRTVVTGFGLLVFAGMLVPPTCGPRSKAYLAAVKSDLKNLASQEEIYFSDEGVYTTAQTDLSFVTSDGVTVTIVAHATGWSAWATHAAYPDSVGCAMYYGIIRKDLREIGAVAPQRPGEIVCTDFD